MAWISNFMNNMAGNTFPQGAGQGLQPLGGALTGNIARMLGTPGSVQTPPTGAAVNPANAGALTGGLSSILGALGGGGGARPMIPSPGGSPTGPQNQPTPPSMAGGGLGSLLQGFGGLGGVPQPPGLAPGLAPGMGPTTGSPGGFGRFMPQIPTPGSAPGIGGAPGGPQLGGGFAGLFGSGGPPGQGAGPVPGLPPQGGGAQGGMMGALQHAIQNGPLQSGAAPGSTTTSIGPTQGMQGGGWLSGLLQALKSQSNNSQNAMAPMMRPQAMQGTGAV